MDLSGNTARRSDSVMAEDRLNLRQIVMVPMPLDQAEATRLLAFRPLDGGTESLAVIVGTPVLSGSVPVIVHRRDVIADLVGNLGPHLGPLRQAVATLAGLGGGVLLYVAAASDDVAVTTAIMLHQLAIIRPKFIALCRTT